MWLERAAAPGSHKSLQGPPLFPLLLSWCSLSARALWGTPHLPAGQWMLLRLLQRQEGVPLAASLCAHAGAPLVPPSAPCSLVLFGFSCMLFQAGEPRVAAG